MSQAVYRNYDSEALYAQYNNRGMIDAQVLADIKADQERRADAVRANISRAEIDIAYGAHERERLDLFLPGAAGKPPLFAFIHGGYWQWNDKTHFAFLTEQLVPAGAAFANIEYALCPGVTLAELTAQIRRAVIYLWRHAGDYGYDPDRIVVSGHSAGGHLTAMMMATDWRTVEHTLPRQIIAGGLPISGIYDLEPIRLTPLNDAVRLDKAGARALSPMFMPPQPDAPMAIAVGGAESAEFHRQAAELASGWARLGIATEVLTAPGRDHFTILNALTEPDHEIFAAARRLLGI